jgi:hypothetical protein
MKNDVTVKQNLFANCTIVAQGPGGAIAGLTATDNARDGQSAEGKGLTLGSEPVTGTLPTDPADDVNYLRTPKGSPFSEFGSKKVHVGAVAP